MKLNGRSRMNDEITRAEFMKRMGVGVAGLVAAGRLFAAESDRQVSLAAQKQPNVVWIYCDELRTDALGCCGHPSPKFTLRIWTASRSRACASPITFCLPCLRVIAGVFAQRALPGG